MAFANFFDRAATAASQVLQGFDLSDFRARLDARAVGLAFDGSALRSPEGAAILDLSVRLLARLYPALSFLPLDEEAEAGVPALRLLAQAINPDLLPLADTTALAACIVVGPRCPGIECPVFFTGSDGWTARLSREAPRDLGSSRNPFGAGAAACLAVANVFRILFGENLPGGACDREVELSLLGFGETVQSVDPGRADLGDAYLVGVGAIGHGAVWALSRIEGVRGRLHLVDHERIDLSNLQRYVLADQASVGASKVELAAGLLGGGELDVVAHAERWGEFALGRGDWRFDRVAVALDTAGDRIGLQGSLPRWIANAWTRDIALGVSRHEFLSEGPCLACLYMPDGAVKPEDVRVAEEIGLPEAVMEVRHLLATNAPVDAAFVARIVVRLALPPGSLDAFVGSPLRSFYQQAICGGVVFRLTEGGSRVAATVPMAFQSALAGIMLAAELVKHALGVPASPVVGTRLNLLRPLTGHYADPRARDRSGRCLCADPDFLGAYRRKYEVAEAT